MSDRTDLRPSQLSTVFLRLRKIGVSVQRALFGVGLMRTGGAILRKLRRTELDVENWKSAIDPGSHPFDTAFGVETGGFISWRDLQSGSANDPYISGYLGVVPSICRRMIDAVESPAHYVFTDYGCGKGRAAIIASEQPFRRVIGIEIVDQLAETARRNAAIIANNFPRRPAIEIVHDDASHYELPLEPLVMFFFQPFERPVMQAVLDRIEQSLLVAPRPIILLYLNPLVAKLLDRSRFLHRLGEWSGRPGDEELPFSLCGRGDCETFIAWGTWDAKVVIKI